MNHTELINAVARRLYGYSRQDVANILEVMLDIWREELLAEGGYIQLREIGKIHVECQTLAAGGFMAASGKPVSQTRCYIRFTPSRELRKAIKQQRQEGA